MAMGSFTCWGLSTEEREKERERERERERVLIKESESDKSVPNGWHMFSFQTPHT